MCLDEIKKANIEARKLVSINVPDFVLENPNNWPKDFLRLVMDQYLFLQKLKAKAPDWAMNPQIIAAAPKNIEQSSSKQTAEIKFEHFFGTRALDLTGGFGIDTFRLTRQFDEVEYCEPNTELNRIVQHNFGILGLKNVQFHTSTAEKFLDKNRNKYDLIFLDPDRRPGFGKKAVSIEDCQPNLFEIEDKLCQSTEVALVKYSPMLDVSLAVQKIRHVQKVRIIALKNEVKELLLQLGQAHDELEIESINIESGGIQRFSFMQASEKLQNIDYSETQRYLYEPNVAILKAGAFKTIAARFGLGKIAPNSHFYTSNRFLGNFPGRKFEVLEVFSPQQKQLKAFKNRALNVIARNYPQNAVTLKKKFGLIDGSDDYLIFTENTEKRKIAILAKRIYK